MPVKKYHEKLAENLAALKDGKEPPHKGDVETDARKQKSELDDAQRQAEIMDPSGAEVELSFGKLKLYPFTMFDQATARGYCDGIMADVFGEGARSPAEMGFRVTAVLLSSAKKKRDLLSIVAIASDKPGVIDSDDKATPIARKLADECSPDDYVILFKEIQERARVKRDPKK